MVDLLLAGLEVQLESHGEVLAESIVLGSICKEVPLLVVLRNGDVLFSRALVTKPHLKRRHLILPLGEHERLLNIFGQEEEFHRSGNVSVLSAVLGHSFGSRGKLCFPDELESLLWLVELLQGEPDDAVQVSGSLVRLQGLSVSTARLLRLGVLQVQLGRVDLVHQWSRSFEVEIEDVQRGRLVVGTRCLVELGCLDILLHLG
mmetsp:Transcript_29086/g.46651  ORF Transcript_29086/g.46651 Transcript_29086/m.46651 type:complete len:203 (-) Transcript_29086:454-1062(-)